MSNLNTFPLGQKEEEKIKQTEDRSSSKNSYSAHLQVHLSKIRTISISDTEYSNKSALSLPPDDNKLAPSINDADSKPIAHFSPGGAKKPPFSFALNREKLLQDLQSNSNETQIAHTAAAYDEQDATELSKRARRNQRELPFVKNDAPNQKPGKKPTDSSAALYMQEQLGIPPSATVSRTTSYNTPLFDQLSLLRDVSLCRLSSDDSIKKGLETALMTCQPSHTSRASSVSTILNLPTTTDQKSFSPFSFPSSDDGSIKALLEKLLMERMPSLASQRASSISSSLLFNNKSTDQGSLVASAMMEKLYHTSDADKAMMENIMRCPSHGSRASSIASFFGDFICAPETSTESQQSESFSSFDSVVSSGVEHPSAMHERSAINPAACDAEERNSSTGRGILLRGSSFVDRWLSSNDPSVQQRSSLAVVKPTTQEQVALSWQSLRDDDTKKRKLDEGEGSNLQSIIMEMAKKKTKNVKDLDNKKNEEHQGAGAASSRIAMDQPTGLSTNTEQECKKDQNPRNKRRRIEKEPETKQYFQMQGVDVIFGRGTGPNIHNKLFRDQEVAKRQAAYLSGHDGAKMYIVIELFKWVKNRGGRFLAKDDKGWYEVTQKATYTKIRQIIREYKTPEERQDKRAIRVVERLEKNAAKVKKTRIRKKKA